MTRAAEQFATCSRCLRCNTISLRSIPGDPELDNFCKTLECLQIQYYSTMSVLTKRFWNARCLAVRRSKSTVTAAQLAQSAVSADDAAATDSDFAKEYSELPGPRTLPLLGNSWRFMSYVGEYSVPIIHVLQS